MASLLETLMLTCFGISWPISLVNNYRSRTAKGMSPLFMGLIILGYSAGITAKLISGNAGLVLGVYFFNLAVVLMNLAIYFRNRHLDKKQASKI